MILNVMKGCMEFWGKPLVLYCTVCNTGDYNSFPMAILNQNHREIDIAELIISKYKICNQGGLASNDVQVGPA